MKKSFYCFLPLLLLGCSFSFGQNFDWAKTGYRPDCNNGVYPRDVTSSPNGSVTSTGYFYAPSTTVNFDGLTLTQLGTGFASDVFVANYNQAGDVQWLRRIGTQLSDGTYPRIDTDDNDNIFVATDIAGSTSGVPGDVAGVNLAAVYPNDAVLTKLNSAGNPQWVQHFTDETGKINIRDIDVDGAGNSYITGSYENSITVDGTTQTADGVNFFLAKFDTDGNLVWWESSNGANNDIGYRVHVKGSDVFVLGQMAQGNTNNTMTVGGITHSTPNGEDRAHFLLKYDTDGDLDWFRYGYLENSGLGSGIFPFYCDIAVDDQDNIYIIHTATAESSASADYIYGGSSVTYNTVATSASNGQMNYIITKYTTTGNVEWARGDGATNEGATIPTQMILHSNGNLIVTNLISNEAVIDGATFTSAGSNDVVIAQFDLEAELICYKQYGGTNQHWAMALDENPDGTCAYAGHAFGGTTFDVVGNYDGIEIEGCRNTGVTASFATKGVNADFTFVNYPSGEVCQPNGNGLILSASPSGFTKTFSSTPSGLAIDSNTGEIDVNASTPGTYMVSHVLTDGTVCGTDSVAQSFTINAAPSADAGDNFSVCGGSASLSGNTPLSGTGTWSVISGPTGATFNDENDPSTGVTGLTEGTHVFEWAVTNACGTAEDEVTVTINDLPVVNAGDDQTVCANHPAISLTGTPSGGTFSGQSVSGNEFDPAIGEGTYTITYSYTDGNGCEGTDQLTITVDGCASLAENEVENTIHIQPNPATAYVDILGEQINAVYVYTAEGRLVHTALAPSSTDSIRIDVNKLNKGTYLVKVQTNTGITTRKIVLM